MPLLASMKRFDLRLSYICLGRTANPDKYSTKESRTPGDWEVKNSSMSSCMSLGVRGSV